MAPKKKKVAPKKKVVKKTAEKKTAEKKTVEKKAKTGGRLKGVNNELGIQDNWAALFAANEKAKKADRLTDEQILEAALVEFPTKSDSSNFKVGSIQSHRRVYNSGKLTEGEVPKTLSRRFDEEGEVVTGRVSGKKPDAPKAKKAVAKKVPAKKAVAKKKVAKKKA